MILLNGAWFNCSSTAEFTGQFAPLLSKAWMRAYPAPIRSTGLFTALAAWSLLITCFNPRKRPGLLSSSMRIRFSMLFGTRRALEGACVISSSRQKMGYCLWPPDPHWLFLFMRAPFLHWCMELLCLLIEHSYVVRRFYMFKFNRCAKRQPCMHHPTWIENLQIEFEASKFNH